MKGVAVDRRTVMWLQSLVRKANMGGLVWDYCSHIRPRNDAYIDDLDRVETHRLLHPKYVEVLAWYPVDYTHCSEQHKRIQCVRVTAAGEKEARNYWWLGYPAELWRWVLGGGATLLLTILGWVVSYLYRH